MFEFGDLIASEQSVAALTARETRGAYDRYPAIIDVLLKLPHFSGKLHDPSTEEGLFAFFAHSQYLQAPFTARAVFLLLKRGYYLEATILLRTLSEVLVQLRYFQSRHAELVAHLDPKQKSVRFITMFDAVMPGYYRKYYGNLHSAFVHGKLGPLYFRYELGGQEDRRIREGCEYVDDYVSFVLNQLNVFLAGFVNLFVTFFPGNSLLQSEFQAQLEAARESLADAITSHRCGFPQSEPWHQVMQTLIQPSGAGAR